MPIQSPSTTLYQLGKGIVSIAEWTDADGPAPGEYVDVGNSPRFEAEVNEEVLDHFSARAGTRTKDKQVVHETGYAINFDLDEISVQNMQMFLKATLSGTNVLKANTQLDKEHAIKFVADNPAGNNQKWEFWKCKLSPGGSFSLIGDEWAVLTFTAEGFSDIANNQDSPYFNVTFATTTTTTTSV
jgi:hypothetical protein